MTRILVLTVGALAMVSCSTSPTNGPYRPATRHEKVEFAADRLDVYPDDVRKKPDAYTNTPVAWVGIIRGTDAQELDENDKVQAKTVFEHHYFDWVQESGGAKLAVSPRGEGLFRAKWYLDKTEWCPINPVYAKVEKYAGKGKLAIFYGVPLGVDSNGTVVLKYRYLRILDQCHYSTNEFDYGRLGEQDFRDLHPTTNAPAVKSK